MNNNNGPGPLLLLDDEEATHCHYHCCYLHHSMLQCGSENTKHAFHDILNSHKISQLLQVRMQILHKLLSI